MVLVQVTFFALLVLATLTLWVPDQWPRSLFEAGMFGLAAYHICRRRIPKHVILPALVLAVPAFAGLLQIGAGTTVDISATLMESLQWTSLAATLLSSGIIIGHLSNPMRFVKVIGMVGVVLAAFAVLQFYTSEGRILWLWPSGDPRVFGTFHNRNNFASFVCLILPVTLWFALDRRGISGIWTAAAVVIAAGVVTSGSRAGMALMLLEVAGFVIYGLSMDRENGTTLRVLAVCGCIAAGAAVMGWDAFALKLQDSDPLRHRREMALSAIAMAQTRPLLGFGLGAFSAAYPAYATFDTGLFVNYAHNDWLEFAAEGGLGLVVLIAGAALWISRFVLRHPWALGIPIVCLHAMVDYPLQRIGVSAWLVTLAGALIYYAGRENHRHAVQG
jgi:O-antigen ligase